MDPSAAVIEGLWAADNTGVDILINGAATGNTSGGFGSYDAFLINSGFIAGANTLDFVVTDIGVISGFRVESIQLSLTAVPEPETYAGVAAAGLVGFALLRRRSAH